MKAMRKLFESRSQKRRWIYLICACVASLFALWAFHEGFIGTLPYISVAILCMVQFFRPTIFIWAFLAAIFLAYAIGVLFTFNEEPFGEFLLFFMFGCIPALTLMWAWPRAGTQSTTD